MEAVKGYISDGWFTPNERIVLPRHARVSLVIEEIIDTHASSKILTFKTGEAERQARMGL